MVVHVCAEGVMCVASSSVWGLGKVLSLSPWGGSTRVCGGEREQERGSGVGTLKGTTTNTWVRVGEVGRWVYGRAYGGECAEFGYPSQCSDRSGRHGRQNQNTIMPRATCLKVVDSGASALPPPSPGHPAPPTFPSSHCSRLSLCRAGFISWPPPRRRPQVTHR